jgi:iron complex outermembrane receptor protein
MKGAKVAALLVALCLSHGAWADERQFDLSAMDAVHGIPEFARQAGIQIVAPADGLAGISTPAIRGSFDVRVALKKLLVGTDLEIASDDGAVITLRRREKAAKQSGNPNGSETQPLTNDTGTRSQSVRDSDELAGIRLEEVIVTAQKRQERQQDVPIAMTVLNPEELALNGQGRLIDYFGTVPGLSVQPNALYSGTQYITIRGLSAGQFQNATVATIIDDVPTGSGSVLELGNLTSPDIDPSDLARIEVLKGPQGTLYGADSLGGLIKYVTVDPSTDGLSGRVEISGVDIPVGGLGYTVRGAVNIPVSDTLAIRASGFSRRDPGYIDDITSGQRNVNSVDVYGGRLSAMWRPSADISLKVSALVQDTHAGGDPYFDVQQNPDGSLQPTFGYLKMTGEAYGNPYQTQQELYSATLRARVVGLDLISVSGYAVNKLHDSEDNGTLFNCFFGSPSLGCPQTVNLNLLQSGETERNETDKFSQELRLSSSVGKWLDWLVGGFYTHERAPSGSSSLSLFSVNPATEAPGSVFFTYAFTPFTFSEEAIFGDLTLHFTDRFNLQLGGRESWNRTDYRQTNLGPGVIDEYGVPSPDVQAPEQSTGSAFTYLVTPQFKISTDAMIYARIASGYRIGGPNYAAPQYRGDPVDYKPDTSDNFEIGTKGEFLNHRISVDAAVYYIKWHDFQIGVAQGCCNDYTINAGNAKSEGVELAVQAHPVTGLTITAQGSFNEAELTQDMPPGAIAAGAYGVPGNPLPYSIRWSGGVAVNQDFSLSSALKVFVGGQFTYVGSRPTEFGGPPPSPRVYIPSYTTLNLRA